MPHILRAVAHARRPPVTAPQADRDRRGGTAGHVVPAIAIADALRAEGAEVSFVGGERAEAELVPQAGYELDTINVEGISRSNPLKAARALGKAGAARHRPRARSSSGARPTPSSAAAATSPARSGSRPRSRRSRSCSPRPTSHLGLTNRALARRAARVCLAFPLEGRDGAQVPRHRPRRPADLHRPRARPRAARHRARRDLRARLRRQPRRALDQHRRPDRLSRTRPTASSTSPARATIPTLTAPGPHYVLLEYLTPFGIALAAADAAVARAGGSVFELAQYGLPSVLIPYPHAAANHQETNARWMAERGAALRPPRRRAHARAAARGDRRAARAAATRWPRPPARSPGPTRPGTSPREVLRAAR